MTDPTKVERLEVWRCSECERMASVPEWCQRPICVHAWEAGSPEIWDGDDVNGEGRPIEWSPNEAFRSPGPDTWAAMERIEILPAQEVERLEQALRELVEAVEQIANHRYSDERSWNIAVAALAQVREILGGSDGV